MAVTVAATAAAALFLSACGGSSAQSTQPDGQGAAGSAAAQVSGFSTNGITMGTIVPVGDVVAKSTDLISAVDGGNLTLELPDGSAVALSVPAGALGEDVIVRLIARKSGQLTVIDMEPDGLWLTKPAVLSYTGPTALLFRIGALPDGDLFTTAAQRSAGQYPIVRLRPVLIDDGSVTPTLPSGQGWSTDPPSSPDAQTEASDASDGAAANAEAAEVANPNDEVEETDQARQAAAAWAQVMTPRCTDPKDPASVRLAAIRQTAGLTNSGPLPDCITRAISMSAEVEYEAAGDMGKILSGAQTVAGQGEISNEVEQSQIPLEGEAPGADRSTSWLGTAMIWGMDQMLGGMANAKEPTGDRCRVSPLENGVMGVRLDVLPDDTLQVTLEPISGEFTVSCGGEPMTSPIGIWAVIRALKGMGENQPFVFTLSNGKMATNVWSDFRNAQEMGAKISKDGVLTAQDSEMRFAAGMTVNVFESMAELKRRSNPTPDAS